MSNAAVDPNAADALPTLLRRQMVVRREAQPASGEYAFQHQLLHQVTYDTVLKRHKREFHRRTADWLVARSGDRVRGGPNLYRSYP